MDDIEIKRDCDAIGIPKGQHITLPKGSVVRIVQERDSSYIVSTAAHAMYRIDAKDADALGIAVSPRPIKLAQQGGTFSEQLVWDALKTVYDPELPANIVDLGLVYSCGIETVEGGKHIIKVRMALTSPGCSMSDVIKSQVKSKLSLLPSVTEAHVEVVFDPPWSPERMSEEARLQLNFEPKGKQQLIGISSPR